MKKIPHYQTVPTTFITGKKYFYFIWKLQVSINSELMLGYLIFEKQITSFKITAIWCFYNNLKKNIYRKFVSFPNDAKIIRSCCKASLKDKLACCSVILFTPRQQLNDIMSFRC